jgi:hypothetical protein
MTLRQLVERRAFLLALVDAIETPTGVEIDISDDAPVAVDKATRNLFERDPSCAGKWRWSAGGGGLILALRDANLLLTIHRDSGAPSYAGHDTLSSGLSSSTTELMYPMQTAWRECVEELCVVAGETILCPVPDVDHFGFGDDLDEVTRSTANLFPELRTLAVKNEVARFLTLPGERDLTIRFRGRTRTTRGLIAFDPGTRGIDLLKAVVLRVDLPLDEVRVYDGETSGGKSLDRQVNAVLLDDGFRPTGRTVASWKRGERIAVAEKSAPMTPVLASFMEALAAL